MANESARPGDWVREQLAQIGTPEALRYLDDDRRVTKLDRIVQGLPPERGAELLRVAVNLGVSPDDHAWVLCIALGQIAQVAEDIPARAEDVLRQINEAIDRQDDNDAQTTRARLAQLNKLFADVETKAVQLAEAAMRSQFVEEEAKNRLRLTSSIDAFVRDYGNRIARERGRFTREQTRSLGAAAALVALTFALGTWAGNSLGYERAVAAGVVSDQVYRLELLGAGWQAYRASLDANERAEADAWLTRHEVFLPNPRTK